MVDLTGKRALVTGGNRGIGRATAQALAAAGAEVTVTVRMAGAVPDGPRLRHALVDVTDRDALAALMADPYDIVVNNAGIVTPIGRIDSLDIAEWARAIEVDLVAAFHVIQLSIRGMTAAGRGGGTIVNLSSGAAGRPLEGWSAYCAAKAGLAMVTQSVHEEFGAQGVRVFGFRPGVVDTDMQGTIRASRINPVSRLARSDLAPVDDPARAIVWLCGPDADAWLGQEVDVRNPVLRAACGLPPVAS